MRVDEDVTRILRGNCSRGIPAMNAIRCDVAADIGRSLIRSSSSSFQYSLSSNPSASTCRPKGPFTLYDIHYAQHTIRYEIMFMARKKTEVTVSACSQFTPPDTTQELRHVGDVRCEQDNII